MAAAGEMETTQDGSGSIQLPSTSKVAKCDIAPDVDSDDSIAIAETLPPNLMVSVVETQQRAWLAVLANVSRESRRLVIDRCRRECHPYGTINVSLVCSSLPLLMWAVEAGCPLDGRTFAAAARAGNLRVLEWLRSRGCPWDWRACCAAAINGDLTLLQWLKREGCPWDEFTCWGAAVGGHLHVLQWARGFGCSWDEGTCCRAALGGHLEVLQWAVAHGCPFQMQDCLSMALKFQKYHVAAWIELGCTSF